MEKIIITAEYVEIHCYIGKQQLIYNTLVHVRQDQSSSSLESNIKIIFFVLDISLKEYNSFL